MTSEHPNKACQETGTGGKVCWLVLGHPGRVHVDVTDGGLVVWSPADGEKFRNVPLNTEDPTRDAPEALKADWRDRADKHVTVPHSPPDEQQCAAQHPRNVALHCARRPGHSGDHRRWRPNQAVSGPQTIPAPADKDWLEVEPQVPLKDTSCPSFLRVGGLRNSRRVGCDSPRGHAGLHQNAQFGQQWGGPYGSRPECRAWSPSGQNRCTEPLGHPGQHRRDNGGVSPIVWANS